MFKAAVETWHWVVAGELSEALDGLLADNVVFYSPIVYTPQRGKAVDDDVPPSGRPDGARRLPTAPSLHEVRAGDVGMLEFEGDRRGKYVDGVDIIRCDETGRIVELRMMVRPLQAINAFHEQIRKMLASMEPQLPPDER